MAVYLKLLKFIISVKYFHFKFKFQNINQLLMTMEYKGKGKKQIHQQRSTKQHSINNWGEISRNFLTVEEVEINQRFTNLSISGHHNEGSLDSPASLENLTKDEEPDKPNMGAFSKRGSMGFETGTDLI